MGNEAEIPADENLEEMIERVHGARRKDRAAMVAGRAGRTRIGGSYVLDGKEIDPNGNDGKKGEPVVKSGPVPEPIPEPEEEPKEEPFEEE